MWAFCLFVVFLLVKQLFVELPEPWLTRQIQSFFPSLGYVADVFVVQLWVYLEEVNWRWRVTMRKWSRDAWSKLGRGTSVITCAAPSAAASRSKILKLILLFCWERWVFSSESGSLFCEEAICFWFVGVVICILRLMLWFRIPILVACFVLILCIRKARCSSVNCSDNLSGIWNDFTHDKWKK